MSLVKYCLGIEKNFKTLISHSTSHTSQNLILLRSDQVFIEHISLICIETKKHKIGYSEFHISNKRTKQLIGKVFKIAFSV